MLVSGLKHHNVKIWEVYNTLNCHIFHEIAYTLLPVNTRQYPSIDWYALWHTIP